MNNKVSDLEYRTNEMSEIFDSLLGQAEEITDDLSNLPEGEQRSIYLDSDISQDRAFSVLIEAFLKKEKGKTVGSLIICRNGEENIFHECIKHEPQKKGIMLLLEFLFNHGFFEDSPEIQIKLGRLLVKYSKLIDVTRVKHYEKKLLDYDGKVKEVIRLPHYQEDGTVFTFSQSKIFQEFLEDTGEIIAGKMLVIEESQRRVFELLGIGNGNSLDNRDPSNTHLLEEIKNRGAKLIETLQAGEISTLTHKSLDDLIKILSKYFLDKPSYMYLLHIENDELLELPIEYNKALQILGILISDVFDADDLYFEYMYQYLQARLRDGKTKIGLEKIYTEKMLLIQKIKS